MLDPDTRVPVPLAEPDLANRLLLTNLKSVTATGYMRMYGDVLTSDAGAFLFENAKVGTVRSVDPAAIRVDPWLPLARIMNWLRNGISVTLSCSILTVEIREPQLGKLEVELLR